MQPQDTIKKVCGQVNNLVENHAELERLFKQSEEDRYSDKEILHGSDYQVGTVIPEKIKELHDSCVSKFDDIEENIESVEEKLAKTNAHLHTKIDNAIDVAAKQSLCFDAIEQELKARNLVIHGIPEIAGETLKSKLVDLSENVLGISMKCSDIENVYRLGKVIEDTPRKLLVKFRSKKMRDKVYQNRKKTPIDPLSNCNVYINEDLTQHRSKLFHDARKLVKSGRLHSTWSQYGNVMVRTTNDDKPVPVYNHVDLRSKYETTNEDFPTESDATDEDEL